MREPAAGWVASCCAAVLFACALAACASSGLGSGDVVERNGVTHRGVLASELTERDGLAYRIGSDEPFTGRSLRFYPNGQLENRTDYRDGKKNGISEWYWDNGRLGQRAHLENGKKHGLLEAFYRNGEPSFRAEYENGVRLE